MEKGARLLLSFVFFKRDVFLITKDASGSQIVDKVLYKSIRCLNKLPSSAFYFKTNRSGYALFFKNYNPQNADLWFSYLIMCMERQNEAKVEIQRFDLSDNLELLHWVSESVVLQFNYREAVGKKKDELRREEDKHTWIPYLK